MSRLDDWFRDELTRPIGRIATALCILLTLVAFEILLMTRTFAGIGNGEWMKLTIFLVPLAIMLLFSGHVVRARQGGVCMMLLLCGVCCAAMLARLSFIERSSGDYEIYLEPWMNQFRQSTFREAMQAQVGEYNVLYQYVLFLITRLPVPALYAVKTVSFIGDAFLAGAAASLASRRGRPSLAAFAAALLLPTIVLNGGMFAQCDSLYAACALWGLALALQGEEMPAAACFALSLAWKLQAVFLLPIVVVLWADHRLRLQDLLVFLLVLLAVAAPALLGGKTPSQILAYYVSQTGMYEGLTYQAPNFFALFPTEGLDVYAYGNFGIAIALGACLTLVALYAGRGKLTRGEYLRLAVLLPLLIVFFLPRMHERYFYLAEVGAVALAAYDRRATMAAVLLALASLCGYWEMYFPLQAAAVMILGAMAWILAFSGKKDIEKENVIQ